MLKKNIFIFFLIFFIFLLDRITKILVIFKARELNETEIFSSNFINFHLIWNEGIAFGLFSFSDSAIYQIITLIIILVISLLVVFMVRSNNLSEKFAFIFIIGGAIGNLFDRVYFNAVPDFIDLHWNNFHWFIFNIADIFITVGVIWLILIEIIKKKS
tara:strand:+ start:217 stop:690 length:474 start_codon:yes stop_codon:yes gene_type:complete